MNTKQDLFRKLAYLIIFIFIANFLANKFYWYYSIWWFDMLMHFIGGVWLGLVFVWFFKKREVSLHLDFPLIFKSIAWVLLVGILWEVFEFYFINYVAGQSFDRADTISDLLLDLSGGILVVLYFSHLTTISETNNVELQ